MDWKNYYIWRRVDTMSIKGKILTTIVATNLLGSLIILLFFYVTANNIIDENMDIQANEIESAILRNMDIISSDIDHINYALIMESYEKLQAVADDPQLDQDTYESIALKNDLLDIVEPLYQFQPYLSALGVYSKNNRLMSTGTIDPEAESIILERDISINYGQNDESVVATIERDITREKNVIARTFGFLDINSFLADQIENLPVGTQIIAKDQSDNVIAEQAIGDRSESDYHREIFDENSNISFELVLPRKVFLGALTSNLRLMILLCLGIILLGTGVATLILMRITNNIHLLWEGMDKVRNKDLSTSVTIDSKDELNEMATTFNSMVGNINQLMVENQQKETEKKEIEMDFLQAQINPHFLSNTLNSITWMAELQEANNISQLSKALVQLLHSTMYKGQDLITIKEELEHVKSYIHIQQVAYTDSFEVEFAIPDELLDLKVLRFILQPLVENSIIHNYVNQENDVQGLIKIGGYIKEDALFLTIEDNGKGIEEETLADFSDRKNLMNERYSKIGVKNIDKRISLYFGSEYGLSYQSEVGKFTKVLIKLPLLGGEALEKNSGHS